MKISVIVPFYNSETTLDRCARALLEQDFPDEDYEIIMIDNNSSDNSSEIVRRYPRIQLLTESKQGSYAARNRGLSQASGRIIAFTDSDCAPCSDWLTSISKVLSSDCVVLVGRVRAPGDNRFLGMLMDYEYAKDSFVFTGDVEELYYGHTNNMAVRKETFDILGSFQERMRGGDSIFVRSAVNQFGPRVVMYSDQMCVYHLEVNRTWIYFKKVFIYGRSRELYKDQANIRQLSLSEKLLIFQNTRTVSRYSFLQSLSCLILLAVGLLFWNTGKVSTYLHRGEHSVKDLG